VSDRGVNESRQRRQGRFQTALLMRNIMAKLQIGDSFPGATLQEICGATVELPAAFARVPATVVFFYRGRW
jgi:hypothetical protein